MNNDTCTKRQEEENRKIYSRNIPSQPLQPYLDVRPAMTKYTYLPIVEPRRKLNVKLYQMPTFNTETVFNPGNTQSPWSGFSSKINTESELRNQIYALQKCSQATYVPNSNSDLYNYSFANTNTPQMTHNLLFKQEKFSTFDPNPNSKIVGSGLFMNSTRIQLNEIPK